MAIRASVPFLPMLARVDPKILRIVVPVSWGPAAGRVAVLTGSGESRRRMIGVSSSHVGRLMAAITIRWRPGIPGSVANGTPYRRMSSRKHITGGTVVIRRWRPGCRRVTTGANSRERGRNVIWIDGACEIAMVAGITSGGRIDIPSRMAGDARLRNMRSRQRELRSAVVERRGLPDIRIVTLCAIVTETICHVIRYSHSRKRGLVTGIAILRGSGVSGRVTGNARLRNMRSRQRELRRAVVECRRLPGD